MCMYIFRYIRICVCIYSYFEAHFVTMGNSKSAFGTDNLRQNEEILSLLAISKEILYVNLYNYSSLLTIEKRI